MTKQRIADGVAMVALIGITGASLYDFFNETPNQMAKWPIYLTHLAELVGLGVSAFHTVSACCATKKEDSTPLTAVSFSDNLETQPQAKSQYASILRATAVPTREKSYVLFALVAALYWSLVFDPSIDSIKFGLMQHGGPAVAMLPSVMVALHENENTDFKKAAREGFYAGASVMPALALYVLFTYLYVDLGCRDEQGHDYIYAALQWLQEPSKAALMSLGALVATLVVGAAAMLVSASGVKILKKSCTLFKCSARNNKDADMTESLLKP